jgi:hypothetical protein
MGARDEIIEGDKAAGSYDKMMISDVAISLTRTKEMKENNKGIFYMMKNRYGADGIHFNLFVDTSRGCFEFKHNNSIEDIKPKPNHSKVIENFNLSKGAINNGVEKKHKATHEFDKLAGISDEELKKDNMADVVKSIISKTSSLETKE